MKHAGIHCHSIHQSMAEDKSALRTLALGAVGVVYGDIGTSPLYTLKAVFSASYSLPLIPENIFGILSLIFWSLMMVVSLKYVLLVMRADNHGEGGIMALMAQALRTLVQRAPRMRRIIIAIGLTGTALFYGDSVITPAISVLSAVEGLEIAASSFASYILPISLVILIFLFYFQKRGTTSVAALFGPIMCVWFLTLGILGIMNLMAAPQILYAVNPYYGLQFLFSHHWIGFIVMGAVVLAVTGAEALYADMGHFGKKPIGYIWFRLVMPTLVLNYFGQGALLIVNPQAIQNPFYLMTPPYMLYPMLILATVATIIASQAVISGAFSMTRQAMQLGYCPRLTVIHTSFHEIGQVYMPMINWMMCFFVIILVLVFKSSDNLANAYGFAVTGTMITTTLLVSVVAKKLWHWNLTKTIAVITTFFIIDFVFFAANVIKIPSGGWLPLCIGIVAFTLLSTWRRGREILLCRSHKVQNSLSEFIQDLGQYSVLRVPGTAVFMTPNKDGIPHALVQNILHNKILHERIIFVTVIIEDVPKIAKADRLEVESFSFNVFRILIRFGYKEDPDVPCALRLAEWYGLKIKMKETSFFLSRETLLATKARGMTLWREKLFSLMSRNAATAEAFFRIPVERVIELGEQIRL